MTSKNLTQRDIIKVTNYKKMELKERERIHVERFRICLAWFYIVVTTSAMSASIIPPTARKNSSISNLIQSEIEAILNNDVTTVKSLLLKAYPDIYVIAAMIFNETSANANVTANQSICRRIDKYFKRLQCPRLVEIGHPECLYYPALLQGKHEIIRGWCYDIDTSLIPKRKGNEEINDLRDDSEKYLKASLLSLQPESLSVPSKVTPAVLHQ